MSPWSGVQIRKGRKQAGIELQDFDDNGYNRINGTEILTTLPAISARVEIEVVAPA